MKISRDLLELFAVAVATETVLGIIGAVILWWIR